jgi:hypothetical protein
MGNITMSEEAYEAYKDFVNTYKLLNRTGIVQHALINMFKTATQDLHIKKQYALGRNTHTHSGCGAYSETQSGLTLNQAKVIEDFKQMYNFADLNNNHKKRMRIPVVELLSLIKKHMHLRDWKAVNREKNQILYYLDMEQKNIKGKHYVVFARFYEMQQQELAQSKNDEKINMLIDRIKHSPAFKEVIMRECGSAQVFQEFKSKAAAAGIFESGEYFKHKNEMNMLEIAAISRGGEHAN